MYICCIFVCNAVKTDYTFFENIHEILTKDNKILVTNKARINSII